MDKQCKVCQVTKPIEDFNVERESIDGHRHQCKVCKRKQEKKWQLQNAPRMRELQKRWRDKANG